MKNVVVADVMTRSPVIAKPEINLLDAAKLMVGKKVGSLLLVNKKRLVGFLSEKDILWALIKKPKEELSKIRAIDISPKKIATTRPTSTINEALNKMKKLKFERLPVIHKGDLVGIITTRDILSFHPEIYPELREFERIREESDKLKRLKKAESRSILEGICEECGNRDFLYKVNGMMICESCKETI